MTSFFDTTTNLWSDAFLAGRGGDFDNDDEGHNNHNQLRKKETAKEFQHLVDLEFKYLIPLEEEANEFIDVGKNDHLVEF